ncbi:hypothetical protein Clacol_003357 [Clathrus columnatus]|uniref:Thiol-activated cytolysin n=1 Tax=Clathrus columnatus TaxID=1419009 RepID=A0AAV5A4D4_9AGAM|nr:hypothetical protein Clacol_003357 [Clathrus columnatus]
MSLPDDISNIVTQMKTQASTTLGWDVVVNYNEAELNKLLTIAYNEDSTGRRSIKKIDCALTATDDKTGEDYTINYTFNLGSPLIKFIPTYIKPVCSLAIPILGGTAKSDNISQIIGERIYTLTLNNLELATAKGEVSSSEETLFSEEDATPYHEPFVFSENSEGRGAVFINFEASKDLAIELTFTGPVKCPKGSQDPGCKGRASFVDNHLGDLKDSIRNKFLSEPEYKNVQYELARANNSKPAGGAFQLVPKSFMFATYTPDNDSDGGTVLSLFIRTGDTDGGQKPHLNSAWDTLWSTTLKCLPIPPGKTVSIILSKNTIFNSMIEPGLKKQGYSSRLEDTKGSIQIQVNTGKKINEPENIVSSGSLGTILTECRNTAINIVLPDLQLVLEQKPSNNKPYCSGSWAYKYSFSWYMKTQGIGPEGTVNVENTLAEDSFPIELDNNYTLKMTFQVRREKWEVKTTAADKTFWEKWNGGVEITPSWVSSMNANHPKMDIDMGSLNFFVTTNLLLPSREVIDIDTSLGVQVPGDFYIVGNVKKSLK